MEQSVTTGRRGLRLRRSKPTRSRIAELTRRASQKTDWEEGRCERKLPSTLSLPVSRQRKPLGRDGGESLLRQDSPHCVPCAMCQPRGSSRILRGGFLRPPRRGVPNHEPEPLGELEGACPLMHAPPRAAKPQARSDPKSRRTDSGTLSARPLFRR